MKVAIIVLAVAIIGAFAQEPAAAAGPGPFVCTDNAFLCKLKEVWHHVKYHGKKLGGQLADVGTSILGAALDQGKDLLANSAQAVLGTVVNHLNKEGLVGKRDLASFVGKVKEHVTNGFGKLQQVKDGLHAAFKKAVSKLTDKLSAVAALKDIDEETDKKVDAVVDEFNKEGTKGMFAMAKNIAGKIGEIFKAGLAKLKERFGKKVEERAILGFDSLSSAWDTVKGHLSNIGSSIADTFKPHVDALKQGISDLGAKVKEHAGNLVTAAKGHFDTLKGKLVTHVDALKGHLGTLGGHAANAVTALKDAVASIAQQTVDNLGNTVSDAVKTGVDAAGVISDHVSQIGN